MLKRIVSIAIECLFDLGVTVIYATLAGLVIGAVTLSDGGLASLLPALAYAALLPLAVLILILGDAAMRALAEAREARRRSVRSARRFPGAAHSALR